MLELRSTIVQLICQFVYLDSIIKVTFLLNGSWFDQFTKTTHCRVSAL